MPNLETEACDRRFVRWGELKPDRRSSLAKEWDYLKSHRVRCQEWSDEVRAHADSERQVLAIFAGPAKPLTDAFVLRLQSERLRAEFSVLAEQWQRDTQHLSVISKKITHPSYVRIFGMGRPVIPLLLEALRNKPAHWFAALRATTNADPAGTDADPSQARQAWLEWGRSEGYID
jgi:hypothetical protein